MTRYFLKEIDGQQMLCDRNINAGDVLKECMPDGVARKVHHFETILPYGVYVFEPWPAEKEEWIEGTQAFKVVGPVRDRVLIKANAYIHHRYPTCISEPLENEMVMRRLSAFEAMVQMYGILINEQTNETA